MSLSSVDSTNLHVKPPVDLNITAEANRILYVLNKIIHRAKFVGLLGKLLRCDEKVLKNTLDPNSYYFLREACDKYLQAKPEKTSSNSINWSDRSEVESAKGPEDGSINDIDIEEDKSPSSSSAESMFDDSAETNVDRHDTLLSKVLFMLEGNAEINALMKTTEMELTPQMTFFIKNMKEFKERVAVQLNENSNQFTTKEKYMRETFEKNLLAKKEIERLEEELVVTKTDANVCLIGRNILINRHQNKIEKIQKNSMEAIEKRVHESEKAMVNDWKESLVQQERLKQEYIQASEKYASMLKEHLTLEKNLRSKRSKIENQVLGWIQKFDQEIGEKQAEEEEVQALLDKELFEVNEIQRKLDEQEEEYDELMQEKAEYEEEMLEKRLYHFLIHRSARSIQRSFRMYKARKLAKKGKKGKKGK